MLCLMATLLFRRGNGQGCGGTGKTTAVYRLCRVVQLRRLEEISVAPRYCNVSSIGELLVGNYPALPSGGDVL